MPRRARLVALLSLSIFPWLPAPALGEDAPADAAAVRALIRRFDADEEALRSFYAEPLSELRLTRLERFLAEWRGGAEAAGRGAPDLDAAIDAHLLMNHILGREDELRLQRTRNAETKRVLPFADALLSLEDARRRLEPLDARAAAQQLTGLRAQLTAVREQIEQALAPGAEAPAWKPTPVVAFRASKALERLRALLKAWFTYRDGYEPEFAWWVHKPYESLDKALGDYAGFLERTVAGVADEHTAPLIGDPIGRDALCRALEREMIPYTPEELLVIAEREFSWCEEEGRKAATELGEKGDWKAAVEHVKGLHVPPGEQDDLVASQAREAIRFLEERQLVTVPPLAAETWRLEMITEKGQETLPFAVYNDQRMLVAYALEGMDHEAKLQSMRGNNEHFTRVVTPHELIPGHHLQLFMARRHRAYRALFRTPFFVEGWALHWEMLLWDLGWHRGPEDRVGMLFWRMHRCARIIISLGFHLGQMTPQAMVDFLRKRVGLEEDGATAEVRRYIDGSYGPLYQAAYMLGGLQLRALHHELVGNGTMSDRAFHDAALREGSIPVEMVRAKLLGIKPVCGGPSTWRFQGDVGPAAESGPR